MATRRRTKKRERPDVSADVRTPETIRAAFAREMPSIPAPDLEAPLKLAGDDEWAAMETFTLFVWACVDALIDATPAAQPRTFSDWSPVQQALLVEMARLPAHVLINGGELSDRLQTSGATSMVPGDERYLLRYVGLVPPGPLEQVVDGRPLWLWLRLHTMGSVSRDAWVAAARDLDAAARITLSRLAVENAYQLLRRWPFPKRITPEQEAEDTERLFEGLSPILASVDDDALAAAISAEAAREYPSGALLVLLAVQLVERGGALSDACDDALADALPLYLAHGRRVLARLPQARRSAIVARMEPVPHNARGFWTYADLLEPADRDARVTEALATFHRPCKNDVPPCVKALVRVMSPTARATLRARCAGTPNAALVVEAAAQLD